MERVLYNLHHKCCTYALHTTSQRSRSWAEHSILVVAVCGFGALLLAHLTFVHPNRLRAAIPATCLRGVPGFVLTADVTHVSLVDGTAAGSRTVHTRRRRNLPFETRPGAGGADRNGGLAPVAGGVRSLPLGGGDADDGTIPEGFPGVDFLGGGASSACAAAEPPPGEILFSYSREKGYLLLSPELCARHGIGVQHVYVSKHDPRCFGEPFLQTLVFALLGPDTVVINWLLGTYGNSNSNSQHDDDENDGVGGYIYNPRTRVMTDLRQDHPPEHSHAAGTMGSGNMAHWSVRKFQELLLKGTVVIKTSFLFFITTTLVSFTLRETQGRMLDFTHHLQEHVRSNRPVVNLVTTHVVENLVFVPIMVGMIFFLIEFYRGDKFLAFMVLSLVWVCESFSVVRYDRYRDWSLDSLRVRAMAHLLSFIHTACERSRAFSIFHYFSSSCLPCFTIITFHFLGAFPIRLWRRRCAS